MPKNTDDVHRLLSEGIKLLNEHKTEDAEIILRRVLKIQPENADAWWLLGRALYLQERLTENVEAYRKATHLEPERAVFWETLGVTLIRLAAITEGKEALNRAFNLDPFALRPCEHAFGKLIESNSDSPLLWYGLGIVLEIQGKMEISRKAMQKVRQLDPEFSFDTE
ncbi:MAG: tetratricopeptide repeat protein [Candidatus Thorarchaeota archaeon]|jgi:superkiller protein 3